MPGAETDIATIAASLKAARDRDQRPVLFLGSRAGALYSEGNLYNTLLRYISTPNDVIRLLKQPAPSNEDLPHVLESRLQALHALPAPARFEGCYDILSKYFSEIGIHTILVNALAPVRYREADELLSGLIKAGFFDPIITTNIDTLLEDHCDISWNMRQPVDYQVIRCGITRSEEIERGETRYGRIVKIFGDLSYLRYKTAGNEFNLEDDQIIKQYLRTKLSEEVLVIGYDPIWDRPMEQAFSELGGALWYVNEELPPQNTYLMRILNQRKSKYITGTQGNIHNFLKTLHAEISGGVSRDAEINITPVALQAQTQVKKKAFVSYSRKNKEQLERLQTHLKGYLYVDSENLLDYWDDKKFSSGANWEGEIKESLKGMKVAVLLVSADFLASEFIREYELPILLEEERKGEIKLLWVILDPSFEVPDPSPDVPYQKFFTTGQLYEYSVVNRDAELLKRMSLYEQEVVWAKLAEQIYDMLTS